MRFTLRQLEYFVATCEAGSVTEAAHHIPVSQSSVSTAIAQLEAALGVQLLIRHHAQGVSPSPAGRRFLVRARALLREADELEQFASELTDDISGPLELGCLITLAPMVAPGLCQQFLTDNPGVTLALVEADQEELLSQLRSGRLLLALTYDLDLDEDIGFQPLAELPPHAVLAEDHPLAGAPEVTLAELADEPLVLLDIPHSRDYFLALFAAEGRRPTIAHRSTQPEAIRTLVANGYGYTLVNARPRLERALDGRPLKTVRVGGSPRPMVLGIAGLGSARPTRVAEAFREHCRRVISAASVPGLRVGD